MVSLLSRLHGIAIILILSIVPGVLAGAVISVLWLPFITSGKIQDIFDNLIFDRLALNYLAVFILLATAHIGTLSTLLIIYGNPNTTLSIIFASCLGFPTLAAALITWYIPEKLDDTEPIEIDWKTRLIGILGIIWYAVLTAAPLLFLTFFYYLPL